MKKIFSIFLVLNLFANYVVAETVWADDSINDEIKVKYNTNAIEEDLLPPLPAILTTPQPAQQTAPQAQSYNQPKKLSQQQSQPTQQMTVVHPKPSVNYSYSVPTSNLKGTAVLHAGTKFHLRLDTNISDMSIIGTKVYFTTQYPETNRYITIPAGSRLVGIIADAHPPQISGNGGLIVVDVNELQYKGGAYPIKSTILLAGRKRIFFNNIKGKRTYMKNLVNDTRPGRRFYSKSWQVTKRFAGDGLEVILTPITFIGGAAVLAGNVIVAPVAALVSRGGGISVPAGSRVDIKLKEDANIRL